MEIGLQEEPVEYGVSMPSPQPRGIPVCKILLNDSYRTHLNLARDRLQMLS